MSAKERERNNKIKAKLSGHGIDRSWFNEAKYYMEKNGYGINQISTKVVPHIQEEIKFREESAALEKEEKRRKEQERNDQLELIKPKYIEFRNKAFSDILLKIYLKELNLENCREISKSLIDKKIIRENKAGFKYIVKIVFLVGVIYGTLYWINDFVRNASDFHQKIILAVICFILVLPRAFRFTLSPVELQSGDIFSGTIFTEQDMDSSILDYNKKLLKLIEYSLEANKSRFDKTLEEILILEPTSPPLSKPIPPPLPKTVPPPLPEPANNK